MVESFNRTICHMLSCLVADDQNKWDGMIMHAAAAQNNNATGSRVAGFVPNEVHIDRFALVPMTILEGRGVKGHSPRIKAGSVRISRTYMR
ncbi:unnamed protein product [Laminaria digitata]